MVVERSLTTRFGGLRNLLQRLFDRRKCAVVNGAYDARAIDQKRSRIRGHTIGVIGLAINVTSDRVTGRIANDHILDLVFRLSGQRQQAEVGTLRLQIV